VAVTITPVGAEAFAVIQSIAQRTWPSAYGEILHPEQITYMLDLMYSTEALAEQRVKGHRFFLLREGETPLGFVTCELDYLPGTTKIHKLYVLPETQGKGYGKALTEWVQALAREAGQERLRLDVNYKNRAIGFYERLGFVKMGRHDTEIGRGYRMEDFIMEQPL